jgi:tRNA(Ile)-lysidine synthase
MSASAATPVTRAIDAALDLAAAHAARRGADAPLRIAVALSGGRDSTVLFDALAEAAPPRGFALSALHVHHGVSPNADRWAEFCAAMCAQRGVALAIRRVDVAREGRGLEASARAARYRAFDEAAADFVALAHHAEDQAETLLLQLLRGAGPRGLAAMPALRPLPTGSALLRPLLEVAPAELAEHARARRLVWIEDESNADLAHRRNFVRAEIAPRLAAAFPGWPRAIVRAAALQAEAAALIDDLAAADAQAAGPDDDGGVLAREALATLDARSPARARNLLRWFLQRHGLRPPSAAGLAAMLRQLAGAAGDARVRIAHDGAELGVHRGQIVVHAPAAEPFEVAWRGEPELVLPHGTLEFTPSVGAGLALAALDHAPVVVRSRIGGERLRPGRDRPRQAIKRLLQVAHIPYWQRAGLPFVWCGDALAAVPDVGVDVAFATPPGEPGVVLRWRPVMRSLPGRVGKD